MKKTVNGVEVEMSADEIADFLADAISQPNPSKNYRLYKSTLVRRLTEAEATTLKAVLNAAPDKSQMLWAASEWLDSADPLFLTLKSAIAQALGAKRADEILGGE